MDLLKSLQLQYNMFIACLVLLAIVETNKLGHLLERGIIYAPVTAFLQVEA